MVADGRYKCTACGRRTSVTAGTLFDRRRTPLTVWFAACWMFATQKDGVSALSVQRALEIGSDPAAGAMLHPPRAALVPPGPALLARTGGGEGPCLAGEGARPGRGPQRWLLGAQQGAADDAQGAAYPTEFVFRFNRRRSRSRGLLFYRVLELAIAHDPVRYRSLVASPKPKARRPAPPGQRGQPPSMDRLPAARPWRAADLH